jgi:phosphatidylinositol alpha-1,6-mannosyltransferase
VSVDALARVRRAHPDVRLVVVGAHAPDDAYAAEVVELARTRGVLDAVHFAGTVGDDELRAWYACAKVLLVPAIREHGRFEGLGLAYLEAAAAGVPAIGTLDCGAEEAIVDGRTGLLVPQNDPDATAAALERLLSDDALRLRMSDAGRARAGLLSWDRLAQALAERYHALAAERREGSRA